MKKIFLLLFVIFAMSGCGGSSQDKTSAEPEKKSVEKTPAPISADKKILVVYFSRTGEEYNVGNITKGNTAIVAEFIAQKTGADLFEIKSATPYPNEYEACTELAKKELETDARPALAKNIDNLAQYDTIFLGFPIWYSDLPRIICTFLESNDFSGKKIIPFCTSAGDYMTGKESQISNYAKGAILLEGFGIKGKRCQDNPESVQQEVNQRLQSLGY